MEDLLGVSGRRAFSRQLEDFWVLLRPHSRHIWVADRACCRVRCALRNEIGSALEALAASGIWGWVRLLRALVGRLGSWTRGPADW